MTTRVLMAIGQEDLRSQATATFAELGDDLEVIGVAENSSDLLLAVDQTRDIDIVVLDEKIGALPVLALVREIVARIPDVGVMVMTSSPTTSTYQSVMDAGGRAIVESPPAHDELSERLPAILAWQRQLRSMAGAALGTGGHQAGRLITFVGAKGGVGTSTLALHSALLAAVSNPEHRVCLIDLDLQQRGIQQIFDLSSKRTINDLVAISNSLTGRNLEEATVVHRSGLRVLMAPKQGEHAEDVQGSVAREIISVAKGHYDMVIADAGSVVTEAGAVAMEFADTLIVVATLDVPCIRAAQDKIDMLGRLQVAKAGDVHMVFNKVSARSEVQPEFAARMTTAEPMSTSFPDDWKRLEAAANALAPLDLEDGPFRRAVVAMGRELHLAMPEAKHAPTARVAQAARSGKPKRGRRRRAEEGQVTIEAIVGLIVAVMILLVLIQVTLLAVATVTGRRAADAAARIGERGGSLAQAAAAGERVTPGFYDVRIRPTGDGHTWEATLRGPTIVPWLNQDITAEGTASQEG